MRVRSLLSNHPRRILAGVLPALVMFLGVACSASASAPYDMRGEWQYVLTCSCGQTAQGTMLIKNEESSGEYSGTTLVLGVLEGTASGMVAGPTTASLSLVIPHAPPHGEEFSFTVPSGTIEPANNEYTGTGTYGAAVHNASGEIRARRVRTLAQIEQEEHEAAEKAREAKEKAEKELKEREQREAAEKPLREKEAHEREVKEQQEAQARQQAKEQQEAKARTEREAAEKAAKEASVGHTGPSTGSHAPTAGPPSPVQATVTQATGSGAVSFELSNPNAYDVTGELVLESPKPRGKHARHHAIESAFSISANAKRLIKLRLPELAALARHGTLHLTIKVVTSAGGHPQSAKTYNLTLQVPAHARRRH